MKKLILFLCIIVAVSVLTSFIRPKNTVYQEPKIIKLELPVNDVDLVLGALAKLPYEQSAQIINKIVAQAQRQIQDTSKTKKP